MTRPQYRLEEDGMSEMARALSVTAAASGQHPRVEEMLKRDRADGKPRRVKEFLRIERGHTV